MVLQAEPDDRMHVQQFLVWLPCIHQAHSFYVESWGVYLPDTRETSIHLISVYLRALTSFADADRSDKHMHLCDLPLRD